MFYHVCDVFVYMYYQIIQHFMKVHDISENLNVNMWCRCQSWCTNPVLRLFLLPLFGFFGSFLFLVTHNNKTCGSTINVSTQTL